MSETRARLPLSEIEKLPEYQRLTQKQQLFIATYCESGLIDGVYDPVAAVLTAYQCKDSETARVMSYALMTNIRIVEVLNRHFNKEPLEEFLALVDKAIQNKKLSIANMQALRLKGEILGYTTKLPGATPREYLPMPGNETRRPKKSRSKKQEPVSDAPAAPSDLEKMMSRF